MQLISYHILPSNMPTYDYRWYLVKKITSIIFHEYYLFILQYEGVSLLFDHNSSFHVFTLVCSRVSIIGDFKLPCKHRLQ